MHAIASGLLAKWFLLLKVIETVHSTGIHQYRDENTLHNLKGGDLENPLHFVDELQLCRSLPFHDHPFSFYCNHHLDTLSVAILMRCDRRRISMNFVHRASSAFKQTFGYCNRRRRNRELDGPWPCHCLWPQRFARFVLGCSDKRKETIPISESLQISVLGRMRSFERWDINMKINCLGGNET